MDRCSSAVLLLHFLPLFAQRLRAIIGPNTLHYSYLCSVHTRSSTKDTQVCEEADTYVHSCTEARRLAITSTIASPLFGLTPSPVWFLSGAPRPLTGGSVSERCDHAGRVLENKSVSLSPPSIYQISSGEKKKKKKEALRLVVSKHHDFISKQTMAPKVGTRRLCPTQRPPFTKLNRCIFITVIPVRGAKLLLIIETQYNTGHAACSRCVVNQSRAAQERGGGGTLTVREQTGSLMEGGSAQLNIRRCVILLEDAAPPLRSDRG